MRDASSGLSHAAERWLWRCGCHGIPLLLAGVSYAVADLNGDGILDLFIKDYVAGPKSVPAALSRILKGSPDWSVTTPEIAHPSTNLLKANR